MLTTRCASCQTTFKVVKDQLRLADGWVRCGRCQEVFKADDALAQWEASAARQDQPVASSTVEAQGMSSPERETSPSRAELEQPAAPEPPGQEPTSSDRPGETGAQALPATVVDDELPNTLQAQEMALAEPVPAHAASAERYAWAMAPQKPKPEPPLVKAAWAMTAAGALLAICAQAAVAWHDELVQSAPSLRPWVEVACVMADCKIEPARQLHALTVESSQIAQLGGTIYQLTATVRNRALTEIAPPALDLVLTGADGQVLARKVLRWADFGLRGRAMAPQQDVTLQTNLNTGSSGVAGFTIELFYP